MPHGIAKSPLSVAYAKLKKGKDTPSFSQFVAKHTPQSYQKYGRGGGKAVGSKKK